MTYLIKFIIGVLIFFSSIAVHELCHYVPARIMGLKPSFKIEDWKLQTSVKNPTTKEAMVIGLMPIPFVAVCIFMALCLIVDYSSIVNNRLLCLIFMIILSDVSSVMVSISDLKVLYAIVH